MPEEAALRSLESSTALAAIERERFISYSQLVRNLHWLAAALVVLYSLLVRGADRVTLWSLAGVMVLYTLALHSPLFARFPVEDRVLAENGIDLSWITAVVLFSGACRSPFFFLYYIVIYASTPAAGRAHTYLKAGAATALALGVVLPLDATTTLGSARLVVLRRQPRLAAHRPLAGRLLHRRGGNPGRPHPPLAVHGGAHRCAH